MIPVPLPVPVPLPSTSGVGVLVGGLLKGFLFLPTSGGINVS